MAETTYKTGDGLNPKKPLMIKTGLLSMLLATLIVLLFSASQASAYACILSITPSKAVFGVGESWTVSLSDCPLQSSVSICSWLPSPSGDSCTPMGFTDLSGRWTKSGMFNAEDTGTWIEYAKVGASTSNEIAFTVQASVPPARSGGFPNVVLAAGTTQTNLYVSTSGQASCRYSTSPGIAYASMQGTFTTANGMAHSAMVFGLSNGQTYRYYVKCQNYYGNANTDDYVIGFSILPQGDATPPARFNGQPSGTLAAGTSSATVSLATNEYANCRYSTSPNAAYAFMPGMFAASGGTLHSTSVSGLSNGQTYFYYVRCADAAGNANPDDYVISFSMGTVATAHPPVFNSIVISPANPAPEQPLTCSVSVSDTGGNLNNVNFKWYINGVRVWDTNRLVSGSSGMASDTYSGVKRNNDNIVCEARAYDSSGTYATTSHAVHVGTVSNSMPQISYVDITPRHPNPQQDLTCSVLATDADDNLDYVVFEWYVNGIMLRSAQKNIQGSSDTASDTLSGAGRTRQGDSVKCRAYVYDTNGAEKIMDSPAVAIGYVSATNPYYPASYATYGQNPVAFLSANKQCAGINEMVQLSGSGSYDPYGGRIIQYTFDYGDGQQSAWLPEPTNFAYHTYMVSGTYYARLKVKDNQYKDSAWSNPVVIRVGSACGSSSSPAFNSRPVAILTVSNQLADVDENLRFSGSGSYDIDGSVAHYNFDYGDGLESGWVTNSSVRHSYSEDGVYYARLTVKDDDGAESLPSNAVVIRVGTGDSGSGGAADRRPVIDDISVVKSPQSNYVYYECKAEVFDANDDLEYVRFKWYFNGDVLSTEREDVNGRNDEANSAISLQTTPDDTIKCEATVYDDDHNFVTASSTAGGSSEGGGCSLAVKKFDYITYIMEGMKGWAEMEVENTGKSGTLAMSLYVDGALKDEYSKYVAYSEKTTKRFEFPLSVGTHKVEIESKMKCGYGVKKSTEISVFPSSSRGFVPTGPSGGETGAAGEMSVSITPASLDIEINKGNVVTINIESPNQTKFSISVLGLPDGWAEYLGEADVKGSETVFVYVVPKSVGNYNFTVRVSGGGKRFDQHIALYAAPSAIQAGNAGGIGAGLVSALKSNWVIGAVILVVLAVLTALYVVAGRMKKKSYEDHVYGERKAPYYGHYQSKYQPKPGYSGYQIQKPVQPAQRSFQPAQRITNAHPEQPLHWHSGGGHWHSKGGKWFFDLYSDGTGYPKHGADFAGRQK